MLYEDRDTIQDQVTEDGNGHAGEGISGLEPMWPSFPAVETLVPQPTTLEEAGLRPNLLEELVLKCIHYNGRPTAHEVSQTLALPFPIIQQILEHLKGSSLCEVVGSRGMGEQAYEYMLADAGKERANEALGRSQYCGPAPVPYHQYLAVMKRQLAERPIVRREALLAQTQHLVLPERLVGVLGAAVNSGRPILLYGPSGNGKTSLALAMGEAIAGLGDIWVPYFSEAGGQLVRVFDPAIHERVPEGALSDASPFPALGWGQPYDRRWVLVRRPRVTAGGELTMSQFELSLEPGLNFYHAPLQMKATGGMLLIDDFGRQVMRPQDLLNRWIVPLERRQDLLTFHTGQTIEVPLYLILIFATNLEPTTLVDEAYLRRLRYKIHVANPSRPQFRRIFQRACARAGLAYDEKAVTHLWETWYSEGREMRACHPGDIVAHIEDICQFEGLSPQLSPELLDRACSIYFSGQGVPAERAGLAEIRANPDE